MTPPIHSNLLSLVDRAHKKPDLDREQLHVREIDLDVPDYDKPLVEYPVEYVDQSMTPCRGN